MQWNPSCEATPFASKNGLSKEVASGQGYKSIHFCFDLHSQMASQEGVVSQKEVPLYLWIVKVVHAGGLYGSRLYLVILKGQG